RERLRAELLDRTLRGARADLLRVEVAELARALTVVTDLSLAVTRRDGARHRAAVRLAIRRAHARCRRDDRRDFGVAVARLAEVRHERIRIACRLLDRERDRAAVRERARLEAGVVDREVLGPQRAARDGDVRI